MQLQEELIKLSIDNIPCKIDYNLITQYPQISTLRRELGIEPLIIATVKMFIQVSKLVTFDGDGEVFGFWSKLLLDNFSHLRLQEIGYVLAKGVNGKYGKLYGKLTYNMVCDWINEYDMNERDQICVSDQTNKKNQYKQVVYAPEILKIIEDASIKSAEKAKEKELHKKEVVDKKQRQSLEGYLEVLPELIKQLSGKELEQLLNSHKKETRIDGNPLLPEAICIMENEMGLRLKRTKMLSDDLNVTKK